MDKVDFRTQVLSGHLRQNNVPAVATAVSRSPCLSYAPPEALEPPFTFDVNSMRKLMDGHNLEDRDWVFNLMVQSKLFNPKLRGGKVFVAPDYNQSMEQEWEINIKRIKYLLDHGVFEGWLTGEGIEAEMRKLALFEVIQFFDLTLAVRISSHFCVWGNAIKFFGTKRHHNKFLRATEKYLIKGSFAMTELGHGSNVKGIETIATYDSKTREFVINTPCESAQKYWIGGATNRATHTVVFSQLEIDGKNEGVHAFITQIRDAEGNICPNIRIADCGHKIGLNGADNGRIWFDNVHIPRENLLNSVADVSPDGKYVSAIKDPDQRFAAFMAPLTFGRITLAVSAIYSAKISLAIAIRYSLTRRAFKIAPNSPEVLLLDYPSHQRRLLPLLAKTYAMSFAANYLKLLYVNRTPQLTKTIHVVSSAFKATYTWHNMRTLQECREACGGQGLKTENRIGRLKAEYDAQSTLEGENVVLMQQVSKVLLGECVAAKRKNKPFKELGLEHMNSPSTTIPAQLSSSTARSAKFQNDIFCLRERDLLNRFAAQVSTYQAQGESKESAFMMSYQLSEDLGRAFADRATLQSFMEAENKVADASLKDILGLVRSMYALVTLDEDAAFLRYGYLTMENAGTVRKEVANLCGEIRPQALALVSSLGIPDAFLSPIAFDWIAANSWTDGQTSLI